MRHEEEDGEGEGGRQERLSIQSLLPLFSWTRQQQVLPRHGFLQVQVMSEEKDISAVTELIIFKDEDSHELSYTSLRDLLSTNRSVSPIKPKRESAFEDLEVDERPLIKNRLVELAARAYLLSLHAQENPANQFFSRQCARFTETNWLQRHHSKISLQTLSSGDISCLPGPLWVDIIRAFCSLFRLRDIQPQPFLQL
ncbi:hypothetical protein M758_6G179800 [Ceratodon purpureus]|nr:hypothetical protein M758_6G179800 [Ceratodon purpureus]